MNDFVTLKRLTDATLTQLRAACDSVADDLVEQEGPSVVEHEATSEALYEQVIEAVLRCRIQTAGSARLDRVLEDRVERGRPPILDWVA